MPTAEQIQRQVLPRLTLLAAGEDGIYNEINRVITLRSDAELDKLKSNDFAIIDNDVLHQNGGSLSSLQPSLIDRELGGLAIRGQIPEEFIKIANKNGIPVFSLPPDTDITILESKIAGTIREERDRLYKKEQELASGIMDLAGEGRGVKAILEKVKEMSGGTAILLKPDFEPSVQPPGSHISGIQKDLSKFFLNPLTAMTGVKLTGSTPGFITPISGKREYLLVLSSSRRLKDIDRVAAKLGAVALAVELSRRQAVEDTEEKFQNEIIETLLSGKLSPQSAVERAAGLGIDLTQPFTMISMAINGVQSKTNIKKAVSFFGGKAVTFIRGSTLFAIYKLNPDSSAFKDLRKLNKEIAAGIADKLGERVSSGISRSYTGPEGLRISLQEAEQALQTGRQIFGEKSASFFGDLGIYRLLLSAGIEELKSYFRETIGKLADYDGQHGGELMQTLEAILQYSTLTGAAQVLHIHRNTLLYRIERIQEITGENLDNGDSRLRLHLALKTAEIIQATGNP